MYCYRVLLIGLISSIALGQDGERNRVEGETRQRPDWIWPQLDRRPGQSVAMSTTFQSASAVEKATLHVAADFNRCKVILNGSAILAIDEYGPWLEHDVTEHLRVGENKLSLESRSGSGPAAIALSLHIRHADRTDQLVTSDRDWTSESGKVHSFGTVADRLWDIEKLARISDFEDYEQWRRASGAESGTDPATFVTQSGFEVELLRSARNDEGSWVSMAFDPQGRLTIAKEDQGLLRMELSSDGSDVEKVDQINDNLKECRGLLYAYDALYANANNSKSFYRLRDTNGDDRLNQVELLREFPGSVGHGRNDLALGPDGLIYSIHGDAVELPMDNINDFTSPLRLARKGIVSDEGHLVRTDRDGKRWDLVASGLRNPFGIDFNTDGEAFTYDADNEYDMGSPWYRPTRMVQLVSGADFGWRRLKNGRWPPYYPDHADNALPSVDVGKGSPTAVKSGQRSSFPSRYQQAIFALDWAYGRILACHLSPRGAGYACRVETFLAGRPLNVTDLDFGPRGDMFLITGGRKTKSALYRVRFVGPKSESKRQTRQQSERSEFSRQARLHKERLSQHHQSATELTNDPKARRQVFSRLGHPDPIIRDAARIAIEHLPIDLWRDHVFAETDPEIAASALLSLARARDKDDGEKILKQLHRLNVRTLSAYAKLSILHAYRLVLETNQPLEPNQMQPTHQRLINWLQDESGIEVAPLGSGYSVRYELARLVADQHIEGAVKPLVGLLAMATGQRDRMSALYMLCHQPTGWSDSDRVLFFEALCELEQNAFSGAGMPDRLKQIRERAEEHLSDSERSGLSHLFKPANTQPVRLPSVARPFVKEWGLSSLVSATAMHKGNAQNGEKLFREVLCASCHRVRGRGGVMGPDLTAVSSRFSRTDHPRIHRSAVRRDRREIPWHQDHDH